MPIVPEFAQNRSAYNADKLKITSLDDWLAFNRKWFPADSWPRKSDADVRAEAPAKRGWLDLGGRRWSHVSYAYDLSPEDRYEYIYTQRMIGDPLKNPEEKNIPRTAAEGWAQECPHCEITTSQIGADVCPRCGRKLAFTRRAE